MNKFVKYRAWEPRTNKVFYNLSFYNDGGTSVMAESRPLIGAILTQFLGLKDFWEGDIVIDEFTGIVSVIKFGHTEKFGTGFYLQNIKHFNLQYPCDQDLNGHHKVGSIFQGVNKDEVLRFDNTYKVDILDGLIAKLLESAIMKNQ